MRVLKGAGGVLLFFCASMALAQNAIDRSFTTTSKDCSGVQWSKEALATYPNLKAACQAVEERDGRTFVRFQGTVERNNNRGQELDVRIKGGDTVSLTPPEGMSIYMNDRKTPVSQLRRGDELNFYIPEDRFAANFAEDDAPTAKLVTVPVVFRETVMEEPAERTAAALPATASNRGLALLGAFGMFGLALAVTLLRGRDVRA